MNNQFAIIYKEEIAMLRDCKTVTKSVYMALSYHFSTEEKDGVRTRFCCPSYDVISNLTGYSNGSIKRAIKELKDIGILSSKKRIGASSLIYVEYKIDTTEGSHVEPTEGSHVEPTEGSHVKPLEGSHVKPTINNKINNKNLTSNFNRLILSEKQKTILKHFCQFFGWLTKEDYISELENKLPSSCSEYLTDELMLIGAYNLKRIAEKKGAWTGNYFITGIIRWIEGGKGKSSKPNAYMSSLIERLHKEVLPFKSEKKQTKKEQPLKIATTKEGQEDFDWLLDHLIKQYQNLPSGLNRDQLINLKESVYCHDLNLQKIKTAIGEKIKEEEKSRYDISDLPDLRM